ncbi:MAG: D-glycero-beta-D-manno-heptose 1-phosphate adenylyltransferase [Fimbriimonadaceae bacterium]|nr:MAG: D-glycero-beta-D-manno-heptose 1-phosphate adenylyltransferase [Fimbriimonadaceae bacterium]
MSIATAEEIQSARVGKTLVFTNGVFDILHAGHVQYLQAAKELGDLLVVALNTDESVRTLNKGADRPINTLADRATVISALRAVDFVVSFSESTPENLIAEIKPDIHVKGGDYTPEQLPETKIVESYGGKVVILPFLPGRSTTSILQRLTSPPEG